MKNRGGVHFRIASTEIFISFWFVAVASFYSLSSEKAFYAFSAILVHELAHLTALIFFHGEIRQIKFAVRDIDFVTNCDLLSPVEQAVVSASGPAINLILGLLLWKENRDIAYSNLLIGIFQCLPVVSMDGGTLFEIICGRKRQRARKIISLCLSFLILVSGITLLLVSKYNFSLLIIGGYLLFLSLKE